MYIINETEILYKLFNVNKIDATLKMKRKQIFLYFLASQLSIYINFFFSQAHDLPLLWLSLLYFWTIRELLKTNVCTVINANLKYILY